MKRLILAVTTLAILAGLAMSFGCSTAVTAGVDEVIPGVPFPAAYRVLITPEGADAPIATAHRLAISAPAVGTGHDFEFTLQPASDLTPLGTVEVMTARSPAAVPKLSGTTVTVEVVNATELASPAQYRGLVGYEASGSVLAQTGGIVATFSTNAEGARQVSGSFDFTTTADQVPPQLRNYKGTFTGDLIVDAVEDPTDNDDLPPGPPQPPF